jgi:hypothetical protein
MTYCRRIDNAMVKALAQAFRWRDMLESGEYATIREIANARSISQHKSPKAGIVRDSQ